MIDADVSGPELAAGLVGLNRSRIRGSYVTGRVSGIENVGGLAGINSRFGEIRGSYATSHVSGDDDVGGLVGDNRGEIVASYATGRAAGNTDVGGLIGNNKSTGEISASYATGTVSGGSDVGGLIGLFEGGSINASYWDTRTSGHATGLLPFGRTTAQLQSPVDYTGIYAQWNVDLDGDGTNDDPWDFGMDDEYPVLAVDFDGDGDPTWQEFGYQLRAGPSDLTAMAEASEVVLSWTAVTTDHWDPEPDVTYTVIRDDGSMVEVIDEALSRDDRHRYRSACRYALLPGGRSGGRRRSHPQQAGDGDRPQPSAGVRRRAEYRAQCGREHTERAAYRPAGKGHRS